MSSPVSPTDQSSASQPTGSTLQELLREATRDHHTGLEGVMDLMNPELEMPAYRWHLEKFWGFYLPLEQAIHAVGVPEQLPPDMPERLKTPWLRSDLTALGDGPGAVDSLPVCENLPAVNSLYHAAGCLYVMEGSTLGGQLIARQLSARFGLTPDAGVRFFTSYGDQVGPRWKAFCAWLNALARTPESDEQVLSAASQTFERLGAWFKLGDSIG